MSYWGADFIGIFKPGVILFWSVSVDKLLKRNFTGFQPALYHYMTVIHANEECLTILHVACSGGSPPVLHRFAIKTLPVDVKRLVIPREKTNKIQ